jgi:hypothetical protein
VKPVSWTSVVCVLLERLDQPAGIDAAVVEATPASLVT